MLQFSICIPSPHPQQNVFSLGGRLYENERGCDSPSVLFDCVQVGSWLAACTLSHTYESLVGGRDEIIHGAVHV